MHFGSHPLYVQRQARVEPIVPPQPQPRSDLVDLPISPSNEEPATSTLQRPLSLTSPPIPPRSPLRPAAKSISSQNSTGYSSARSSRFTQDSLDTPPSSAIGDFTIIVDPNSPAAAFPMHDGRNSFPSMDELLDAVHLDAARGSVGPLLPTKALPARPDSFTMPSSSPRPRPKSELSTSSGSSSNPTQSSTQSNMTKRQHALLELLSSERAYASDLALIKEIHIPLALGYTVPLQNLPASPPDASSSSARTSSTASDSSTTPPKPPMTQEDVRIIFSNIPELAGFSDMFSEELQAALGSLVDGQVGEDGIGELFLRTIPDLEPMYSTYIARQAAALQHLTNLPSSPALSRYLAQTQTIASSLSHAWDLSSLLIKPVQRLLKYPLLLAAIIDETPDTHPDKASLKEARSRMEEVARNVNEVRRRAEVIREVLTSKKKLVNVTAVAASVKIKNLRAKAVPADESGEAAHVERMSHDLRRMELLLQQFAKNVFEWNASMGKTVVALNTWAQSFGGVIGLSRDRDGESEAFDAFRVVIKSRLAEVCNQLDMSLNDRILRPTAHLLGTMTQPYKLLASMEEQEPMHNHLLDMKVSPKNRPSPAMLTASTKYLALRAQLAAELPSYLRLLDRGVALMIREFAEIQRQTWLKIRNEWGELWEMLRVEGELNAGFEETIHVWSARWMDVDEVVAGLNINQAKKIYQEPERNKSSSTSVQNAFSSLEATPTLHGNRRSSNGTKVHALSSLDPSHSPLYTTEFVSSPLPLAPSRRSRGPKRRNSNDSLHTTSRTVKGKSPGRKSREDRADHIHGDQQYGSNNPYAYHDPRAGRSSLPAIPRRKSMPLSADLRPPPMRRAASPHGPAANDAVYSSAYINYPYGVADSSPRDSHGSGRSSDRNSNGVSRSPSTKKKTSPDHHASTTPSAPNGKPQRPTHNRNRSSSITSFFRLGGGGKGNESERSPAYDTPVPTLPDKYAQQRDDWANKPSKYLCQVIHDCHPPEGIAYYSFPFFKLVDGDLYDILQEAGHPSLHPKLPLYVDDGEDCLLLCRDARGNVGWGLASFMEPVSLPL